MNIPAVQAHHKVFRRLLDKSEGQRSEWEYPFGAAGVNLTFLLQASDQPCLCKDSIGPYPGQRSI